MFASLLAVALTGQILSDVPPTKGDIVALIGDGPKVNGWSDLRHIVADADVSVPSGTLAIFVSKFASVRGFYFYTVVLGNKQGFTLVDQQVRTIKDLDRAKAVYREIIAAIAKAQVQEHAGNRRQEKMARNRDLGRALAGVVKMHGLKVEDLLIIKEIGVTNHWPAADVVLDAQRAAASKETAGKPASLLNVARSWEKNNRPDLALKSYRELVTKYPDSVEAKTAKQRIEVLASTNGRVKP